MALAVRAASAGTALCSGAAFSGLAHSSSLASLATSPDWSSDPATHAALRTPPAAHCYTARCAVGFASARESSETEAAGPPALALRLEVWRRARESVAQLALMRHLARHFADPAHETVAIARPPLPSWPLAPLPAWLLWQRLTDPAARLDRWLERLPMVRRG
jgi:hypothetical protein